MAAGFKAQDAYKQIMDTAANNDLYEVGQKLIEIQGSYYGSNIEAFIDYMATRTVDEINALAQTLSSYWEKAAKYNLSEYCGAAFLIRSEILTRALPVAQAAIKQEDPAAQYRTVSGLGQSAASAEGDITPSVGGRK